MPKLLESDFYSKKFTTTVQKVTEIKDTIRHDPLNVAYACMYSAIQFMSYNNFPWDKDTLRFWVERTFPKRKK